MKAAKAKAAQVAQVAGTHVRAACIAAAAAAAMAAVGAGAWLLHRFGPDTYRRFRTRSGRASVYQVEAPDGRSVRLLAVGGIVQSGTYVDDDCCYDLVFEYLKRYDAMFGRLDERGAAHPPRRVCVVGCGGYDYPEHLVAHHPEVAVVDAVEIDPAITDIARRWFFLDRCIEEFQTERTGRLNLVCADARAWLEEGAAAGAPAYDAIVNDTFDAGEPAPAFLGVEAARIIRARLAPGGIYLTNIVAALEGPHAAFLEEQVADLRSVFSHVEVLPCEPDSLTEPDNVIVAAW